MYDIPVIIKQIDESEELDEKFRVEQDKQQHYDKHIAKDWDDFWTSVLERDENGYFSPKYPPTLDIDTYERKADEIIARDAGTSTDSMSPIVGWQIKTLGDEGGRYKGDRFVKIKKTSSIINRNKFNRDELPVLSDVVIYVVQDGRPITISMYPQLYRVAHKRMMQRYVDELPEHKSSLDDEIVLFGKKVKVKDIVGSNEDKPSTETTKDESFEDKPSIVESLDESYYNIPLLNKVEETCKEIFPYRFKEVQEKGYGYCGWIFPDGTVLDTDYSTQHFRYQSMLQQELDDDSIEFLKLGLIRYNLEEGLLEFPYTPVTEQQLKVLDEVFKKHYANCHFKFGSGGAFRFGDNYRQKACFIDTWVFEDEYPFNPLYRRDGEDMAKLFREYCYTGKIDDTIR